MEVAHSVTRAPLPWMVSIMAFASGKLSDRNSNELYPVAQPLSTFTAPTGMSREMNWSSMRSTALWLERSFDSQTQCRCAQSASREPGARR